MLILQILVHLAFPGLAIYLCYRYKFLDFFSPVALCYIAGAIVSNLPWFSYDRSMARQIVEAVLPVSIALLLFSANFKLWLAHSKQTILAFTLQCISVIFAAGISALFFSKSIQGNEWKIAGMMTGVYSGTTANMFGVGKALEAKEEILLSLSAADLICGAFYFLFILLVAIPFYRKLLPAYRASVTQNTDTENDEDNKVIYIKILPFTAAMILAILIVGVSVAISLALTGEISAPIIFISVTTLSIIASLFDRVRNVSGTYSAGNYLILIFCFGLGSLADLKSFSEGINVYFYIVALTLFLTVLFHFILCYFFRIDSDTVLITSCAGIYGPPFVPAIVRAMKNREILVAGMTTALIGLSIGNYLGLATAYIFRAVFY